MIFFKNVTLKFENKTVLENLNLKFSKGKKYAIMGESGCGKTTILNAISGLIKPQNGKIVLSEECKIAYVFQESRLFDWFTALENVTTVIDLPKKEAEEKAKKILSDLGLEDSFDLYPSELSGGMKQRVSIARAIAYEPSLLLLDEPFGALDEEIKQKVSTYVFDYMKGKTVIMVTHDASDATFADEIIKITSSPITDISVEKSSI